MQTDDQYNLKISLTEKDDKATFDAIWQSPNLENMLVYLPMSGSKSSIGMIIVKFAFPDEFLVEESIIMST